MSGPPAQDKRRPFSCADPHPQALTAGEQARREAAARTIQAAVRGGTARSGVKLSLLKKAALGSAKFIGRSKLEARAHPGRPAATFEAGGGLQFTMTLCNDTVIVIVIALPPLNKYTQRVHVHAERHLVL